MGKLLAFGVGTLLVIVDGWVVHWLMSSKHSLSMFVGSIIGIAVFTLLGIVGIGFLFSRDDSLG